MSNHKCHPVTTNGKQIKVNGRHWADCEDEYKAAVTKAALEQHFCHCRK